MNKPQTIQKGQISIIVLVLAVLALGSGIVYYVARRPQTSPAPQALQTPILPTPQASPEPQASPTPAPTPTPSAQELLTEEFSTGPTPPHEQDGYTLKYPKGWFVEYEESDMMVFIGVRPLHLGQKPGREENAVLVVAPVATRKPLQEYTDVATTILQKQVPSAEITATPFSHGGYDAVRIDVVGAMVSAGFVASAGFSQKYIGFPGSYTQVAIDGKNSRYTINYTYLEGDAASRDVLDAMAESFAFLP